MDEDGWNDKEEDWMENFDPYSFLNNQDKGISMIVVEDANNKSFFTAGEDNWDWLIGHNLINICLEAGFVYDRVIQLLILDGFIPEPMFNKDTRYVYTANCNQRKVTCFDAKDMVELDPCQRMTFAAIENSGIGPTIAQVIETSHFEDNSKLTDEEWNQYICEREKEKEWTPVYPIHPGNHKILTPLQKERGKQLFTKLSEFIDTQSEDDHCPPEICISQDWEISIDFGGWRKDTDIVKSALCLMCQDEGTGRFYLDEDYVMQCIPYLENELEDISDNYLYRNGVIVDKNRTKKEIRWELELDFSDIVRDFIEKKCPEDTLIAVNTHDFTLYSVPGNLEMSDEGIQIFRPEEFVLKKLGRKPTFDYHKISSLIKILVK